MAYIDNVIGMARSRLKAIRKAQFTINLLHKLGFTVNPEKTKVNPTQWVEALGTYVPVKDKVESYLNAGHWNFLPQQLVACAAVNAYLGHCGKLY